MEMWTLWIVDSGDSDFKSLHCLRLVLDWFQQQRQWGELFFFYFESPDSSCSAICLATAVVVGRVLGGERRDRRCWYVASVYSSLEAYVANGRYPSVPDCQQGLCENGEDIFNNCNFNDEIMINSNFWGSLFPEKANSWNGHFRSDRKSIDGLSDQPTHWLLGSAFKINNWEPMSAQHSCPGFSSMVSGAVHPWSFPDPWLRRLVFYAGPWSGQPR